MQILLQIGFKTKGFSLHELAETLTCIEWTHLGRISAYRAGVPQDHRCEEEEQVCDLRCKNLKDSVLWLL